MARIRSVKPEFWADEDLADVSRDARLLYIGLWNLSDEHGRLRGDPRYVKGQLFPYDDDLSAGAVDELLKALEAAGKVIRYHAGSGQYLFLPNLGKHQRLEADKVPSKLPPPPDPSESEQVSASAQDDTDSRADKSAPRADESESGTEDHALLYVAGSMEQGAGSARKPRKTATDDADFARFWDAYPRKVDKGHARKAWATATKNPNVDPEAIVRGAERYRDDHRREDRYTAYPATWLNGERWADQTTTTRPPVVGNPNGGAFWNN
jgi:hypothetical protein